MRTCSDVAALQMWQAHRCCTFRYLAFGLSLSKAKFCTSLRAGNGLAEWCWSWNAFRLNTVLPKVFSTLISLCMLIPPNHHQGKIDTHTNTNTHTHIHVQAGKVQNILGRLRAYIKSDPLSRHHLTQAMQLQLDMLVLPATCWLTSYICASPLKEIPYLLCNLCTSWDKRNTGRRKQTSQKQSMVKTVKSG